MDFSLNVSVFIMHLYCTSLNLKTGSIRRVFCKQSVHLKCEETAINMTVKSKEISFYVGSLLYTSITCCHKQVNIVAPAQAHWKALTKGTDIMYTKVTPNET